MITKSIEKKSPDKSSMRRLVQYLTFNQGKNSRVDEVLITNCTETDDPEMAAIEMESVQKLNKKSKVDKTYHLLVSFRAGEEPNPEILRKIERELCQALGYSDHQRISVVHRDTDNTHMHIAINKVHPRTLTAHTPYFDKLRLRSARIQIEKRYGLLLESGENRNQHASNANDMEQLAGMESLESWIKRQCLNEVKNAPDWQSLHTVLAENGLEIKARGNGFILQTTDGIAIRASSADRSLSKEKLEKKLGRFEAYGQKGTITPKQHYVKAPRQVATPDEMTLYAEYIRERDHHDNKRAMLIQILAEERDKQIAASKALRDAELKVVRSGGWSANNKFRQETIKQQHLARVVQINQGIQERRKAIYKEMGRIAWLPWLQKQAESGREEAVIALRCSAYTLAKKFNAPEITGVPSPDAPVLEEKPIDAVTKKGTVIYQAGKDFVRREANAVTVATESSLDTFIMALEIAKKSFGKKLQVNGDVEYKGKMVAAAVAGKLGITFIDERMEKERKQLLGERRQQEKQQQRENAKKDMER